MAGEVRSHNIAALHRMEECFGDALQVLTVSELSDRNAIFVEDGNHGENRPRQEEFSTTGTAFIRPPDLKDGRVDFENCGRITASGFARVRKGIGQRRDIILTHRATVGRIAITDDTAPEVFVTNPGTTIWRSTDAKLLDQRYLYCFMRSAAFMDQLWSQVGNNCTFDYVSLTQQRGLRVAFPPIREQQAIASILGALDDKIELNRQRRRTLEELARAIFRSWFVDFDPVKAKAAGRTPPGMSAAIAHLFPDRFEDSPLGPIPAGWRVWSLPEVCDINPTRSLPKGTLAPYLDMANMPTQGPSAEGWVMREMGSGMKFVNGDTLVARITPCLENGKTGFVDFLADSQVGWGSTEYIVLRPKGDIPPVFAYLLARTDEFRTFAIRQMTGSSGRQRVPADSLGNYQLALPEPDNELFRRFGELIAPLFEGIKAGVSQARTLAALRDTLLPKLISGELRVPDAERIAGRMA